MHFFKVLELPSLLEEVTGLTGSGETPIHLGKIFLVNISGLNNPFIGFTGKVLVNLDKTRLKGLLLLLIS